jgi:hypothetical protein
MPPAQDPGDPPMNMSRIMITREVSPIRPMSRVLNPAVRLVTD